MNFFGLNTSGSGNSSSRSHSHRHKSISKSKSSNKRFYLRSDNKIVSAYKKEHGPGYVYHKKTSDGTIRNVPISGHTYKTKRIAESHKKT
jgi:hypothetical protein